MIQVLRVCMWWIIPHINRVKKVKQLFWGKLSAWWWLSRNAVGVISLSDKDTSPKSVWEGIDISGCLKMAVLSCWSASFWDSIPLQQPLFPPSSSPGAAHLPKAAPSAPLHCSRYSDGRKRWRSMGKLWRQQTSHLVPLLPVFEFKLDHQWQTEDKFYHLWF